MPKGARRQHTATHYFKIKGRWSGTHGALGLLVHTTRRHFGNEEHWTTCAHVRSSRKEGTQPHNHTLLTLGLVVNLCVLPHPRDGNRSSSCFLCSKTASSRTLSPAKWPPHRPHNARCAPPCERSNYIGSRSRQTMPPKAHHWPLPETEAISAPDHLRTTDSWPNDVEARQQHPMPNHAWTALHILGRYLPDLRTEVQLISLTTTVSPRILLPGIQLDICDCSHRRR